MNHNMGLSESIARTLAEKQCTSATMATNSMDYPLGSACTAEFGMAASLLASVGFLVVLIP